jgi:hypothetical protein
MISMASSSSQRDPIVLTGEYIECSRVVYRALNIIYFVGVDDFEDWDTNTWSFVIDFAKKWDISMIRSLIVQELRYIALQPDKYKNVAWDLLVLSLKLGKSFLASQFFEWKDESNWSDAVYRSDGISLGDGWTEKVPFSAVVDRKDPSDLPDFQESCQGGAFDLGAGSYPHFLRLPPTVVWIILRAQHLATQGDQPPASETYKRLLVQACKSQAARIVADRRSRESPMRTRRNETK